MNNTLNFNCCILILFLEVISASQVKSQSYIYCWDLNDNKLLIEEYSGNDSQLIRQISKSGRFLALATNQKLNLSNLIFYHNMNEQGLNPFKFEDSTCSIKSSSSNSWGSESHYHLFETNKSIFGIWLIFEVTDSNSLIIEKKEVKSDSTIIYQNFKDGKVVFERCFKNGHYISVSTGFHMNGRLNSVCSFSVDGNLVSCVYFTENGDLKEVYYADRDCSLFYNEEGIQVSEDQIGIYGELKKSCE